MNKCLLLLLVVFVAFQTLASEYTSFAEIVLSKDSSSPSEATLDVNKVKNDFSEILDSIPRSLRSYYTTNSVDNRENKYLWRLLKKSKLDDVMKSEVCKNILIVYLDLIKRERDHTVSPEVLEQKINDVIYAEFHSRLQIINESYSNYYSLKDPSMTQLHHLKNGLALEYFFEWSIGLAKNTFFESKFKNILANLDIVIGGQGQWNDLSQIYRSFEERYYPAPIDASMVDSQVLMAFIDNGGAPEDPYYNFPIRLTYSFMKSHIRGKLQNIYRDIYFYFSGDGSKAGADNYLAHPGSVYYQETHSDDSMEQIYSKNLLSMESDEKIKNVDFFWQAHGADSPFSAGMKYQNITKLRYVNNTWCDGNKLFKYGFSYVADWAKYSPGAGLVNNPFPFNFSINFFSGFNLPISLSEVLSRLTQEVFYDRVIQTFTTNEEAYKDIKDDMFNTYTSWFQQHGEGNFSLADNAFAYGNEKLFNIDDSYVIAATHANDLLFDTDIETYPLTVFQSRALDMVGEVFELFSSLDFEDLVGEKKRGVYHIREPSLNHIIRKLHPLINTTLLVMGNRDIKLSKLSNWDFFPLDKQMVEEFKTISLSKDLNNDDDVLTLVRYFVSKLKIASVGSHRSASKFRINVSFDKPVAGYSPALADITMGMIKGFDVSKNIRLDITFVGDDRVSIKARGIKIISTLSSAVELPEIIINHGTGQWQLLRSGIPLFTLDL